MSTEKGSALKNQAAYASSGTARRYTKMADLFPGEEVLLERYRAQFAGDILDIGIGAGRTTAAVAPAARSYLGIDLSPTMIAAAKERFPDQDLRQMDMRAVPGNLHGRQFDVILISFNSIDYIDWGERQTLIMLLGRMLTETGLLIFSTHSLERLQEKPIRFRPPSAERPQLITLFRRPVEHLKQWVRLGRWLLKAPWNRWVARKFEFQGDGFEVVNDSAEHFSLLTVYVDEPTQRRTLEELGLEVVDRIGGDNPSGKSYFHYYIARRSRVGGT